MNGTVNTFCIFFFTQVTADSLGMSYCAQTKNAVLEGCVQSEFLNSNFTSADCRCLKTMEA